MRPTLELVAAKGREVETEIAKIMFDSFVNKTGWKLILSQNVGKFFDFVVKANPGIIEFKCPVHHHSY